VRSLFEAIWSDSQFSSEVAARIRDEVAVLVALTIFNGWGYGFW
jgi:hypothetical protein